MTTTPEISSADLEKLNANIVKIEALSQRLVQALAQRRAVNPDLEGPGQELLMKAAAAWWAEAMANPAKLIEQQVSYWGKALKHYV